MLPVAANCPTPYRRRRPERTLLYRTVQVHFETWLALTHVECAFRRYLECGILAHGFARARCGQCGHDLPVVFSCKGRGVCPSCNAQHIVETAAHLTDHVFPRLPVRQWVLAVPKRLRYFLHRCGDSPIDHDHPARDTPVPAVGFPVLENPHDLSPTV